MFGLKRLFRREMRKAVKTIISAPKTSANVRKNTPVISSQNVTQVSVTTTTVSVVDSPQVILGRCHVIDGDTIAIGKQKIRLAGIDAPELSKPYGKKAKWALVYEQKVGSYKPHQTPMVEVVCTPSTPQVTPLNVTKTGFTLYSAKYCAIPWALIMNVKCVCTCHVNPNRRK